MLSRRTFVSLAAASAAVPKLAAAQPVLRDAAPSGQGAAPSFYQKGNVRIRYQEGGSGFPLLVTPGGGLNSCMAKWPTAVFNAPEEFKNDFRCITMDQRNANDGESTGPIPVDDPWGAFADDQLGLMDHLGIQKFFFMGYCIGGPFAMKLMQRAPDRVVAAVLCQPVGHRPENPDVMYKSGKDNWAPALLPKRPDLNVAQVDQISAQPLPRAARLCVQRVARLCALLPDADAGHARRHPGTLLPGCCRYRVASAQRRGHGLSLEGAPGAEGADDQPATAMR
jgi:pimeloyl-ACP methyl ester carboxylesterase